MKPRILFCNEFSLLFTGYAKYGKELLSRLYQTGKYELVELASYISHDSHLLHEVPWGVCPVLPSNQHEEDLYKRDATNAFGKYKFEQLCAEFKPHICMSIRDTWMMEYMFNSPYRDCYNLVIMPTIDGAPQHEQWLEMYADADGVFSYQDWSGDLIKKEGGHVINYLGSASPSANPKYSPLSQEERQNFKDAFDIGSYKIIGTIMRNQKRKLYPELFDSFRQYLERTGRKDVRLYCHTSYPDFGWDIPKLLNQYGLNSYVLFTYSCETCGFAYPTYFRDAISSCPKCGEFTSGMCNAKRGITDEMLGHIINSFDLYVQYSNCEGFGMPVVEAAACGVPVCGTDYSAMEDTIRKLAGRPIKVKTMQVEMETGRKTALPDNQYFVEYLEFFFNLSDSQRELHRKETREAFLKHYNWNSTAQKWISYFDNVDIEKYEKKWKQPPRIHTCSRQINDQCSNKEFADWLVTDVLGMPEKIGSYMHCRLIRDLNYGATIGGIGGAYFNEMSEQYAQHHYFPFGRPEAYEHFSTLRNDMNHWENIRV